MYITQLAKAVAVATVDEVLQVTSPNANVLGLDVKNTGANALDAFEIWGKVNPSAPSRLLLSLSANYTTPVYPLLKCSADPTALAAGASVWMVLDISAFDTISVKVSSAVGVTTMDLYGNTKNVGVI